MAQNVLKKNTHRFIHGRTCTDTGHTWISCRLAAPVLLIKSKAAATNAIVESDSFGGVCRSPLDETVFGLINTEYKIGIKLQNSVHRIASNSWVASSLIALTVPLLNSEKLSWTGFHGPTCYLHAYLNTSAFIMVVIKWKPPKTTSYCTPSIGSSTIAAQYAPNWSTIPHATM